MRDSLAATVIGVGVLALVGMDWGPGEAAKAPAPRPSSALAPALQCRTFDGSAQGDEGKPAFARVGSGFTLMSGGCLLTEVREESNSLARAIVLTESRPAPDASHWRCRAHDTSEDGQARFVLKAYAVGCKLT